MNRTNRFPRLASPKLGAVLLIGYLPKLGAHAQTPYEVVDLGTLGGTNSFGYSINDSGMVTGVAETGDVGAHAFRYDSTGMHDLGTLRGGTYSYGSGINNSGQVTGSAYIVGNTIFHAFLYDGTKMNDLGTLGGTFSDAVAINNLGMVAGTSQVPGYNTVHAFLYDSRGCTILVRLREASAVPPPSTIVGRWWETLSQTASLVFVPFFTMGRR